LQDNSETEYRDSRNQQGEHRILSRPGGRSHRVNANTL
jgi:hypothetical protein